jgi:hypothetical protein
VLVALVAVSAMVTPAAADAGSVGAAPGPPSAHARAGTAKRIVGGTPTPITSVPYQVYVSSADSGVDGEGEYYESCGGTILDATHVLTAAHCTFMPSPVPGAPAIARPPASFHVYAGTSKFDGVTPAFPSAVGDDPQGSAVRNVQRHPNYAFSAEGDAEDFADDVAVLTLSDPLTFGPTAQPLALTDPGQGPLEPTPALVSGYGVQVDLSPPNQNAVPDGQLYAVDQVLQDATDAALSGPVNALILAAQSSVGSICQGDSGGPLVTGSGPTARLIGVVSFSGRCAANEAGGFTNVAAPEIRSFIDQALTDPLLLLPVPLAPRGGQDVGMRFSGDNPPSPGDRLTCLPGTWSNLPSFTYAFTDTATGTVIQDGPGAVHEITAADVGRRIACRATATTPGGVGRTPITVSLDPVLAPPPPKPDPKPEPKPEPQPVPKPTPTAKGRLSLAVSTSPTRVRPGRTLRVTVVLRNTGGAAVTRPRVCVRVPRATSVASRGGATLRRGQLCWTAPTLSPVTTRQRGTATSFRRTVALRVDRNAPRGSLSVRGSASGGGSTTATSADRVTVVRTAPRPSPGGVTG